MKFFTGLSTLLSSHVKFGLNLEIGVWQPAIGAITVDLKNSGSLCAYDPEFGMFIPISGTFSPYFPMNGLERRHFLRRRQIAAKISSIFPEWTDFARITTFYVLIFFLWSFQAAVFCSFFGAMPVDLERAQTCRLLDRRGYR